MSFSDYFDMEKDIIDENCLILRIPFKEDYLNKIGAIHGGVIMTLADNASGDLANSFGMVAPTLSMTTHFLRPIIESKYIYAKAEILKKGKRIITVDCTVYGDDEKIAATTRTEFAVTKKR
ncbi:PaaI family thioesterase [Anaerococcus sp. Marseille-P3915]|uniref:PaaI family thioesterase n=1 Tax=Anaerococcus sp. Marseille-P3915 TaxID=2057799 RepID=UPI000D0BC99F|nr:PaaI family thioesterase [Anaerococcus sp. Marseille-P3915]